MLRDRGFTTGGVVSAYVLRKETGIGQGFDFFDGEMPPSSPELSIGQVQRDGARVGADRRALARLDRHRARLPLPAPLRAAQAVRAARALRRSTRRTTARSPTPTRSSAGWCSYLKSHQLYDRSTIVLLSDHGEGLGDHGEQEHGLFVYDEAIHVPLIIKQEGNAGAGTAGRRPGAARRPRADDPRPGEGAGAGRLPRPLAQAGARGHRPAGRHAGLLGGALRALSLRLERADRADRRRATATSRRRARSSTTSQRDRAASAPTSPTSGRRPRQALRGALDRRRRRRDDSGAGRGLRGRARAAAGARLRRRADRRRRPDRARRSPIRRTSARFSSATARPSTSPASGSGRRRSRSCSRSFATIRRWPTSGASSPSSPRASIATTSRVDAYKHYIALKPQEPTAYIGAAAGCLKLREARTRRASMRSARGRRRAARRPSIAGVRARDAGQDRARQARRRGGARRGDAGARRGSDAAAAALRRRAPALRSGQDAPRRCRLFHAGDRGAEEAGRAADRRAALPTPPSALGRPESGIPRRRPSSSPSWKHCPHNTRARGVPRDALTRPAAIRTRRVERC